MIISEKSAGLLLHISSLPTKHGIGDIGSGTRELLDFLVQTEHRYWQILPIHPVGYGESPYQSYSAFAGEELFIDPLWLYEDGYLKKQELEAAPDFSESKVNYEACRQWKEKLFQQAFLRFNSRVREKSYSTFLEHHKGWLEDYCLFRAIKDQEKGKPWHVWPSGLRDREKEALEAFQKENQGVIRYYEFLQYCFFTQWEHMKRTLQKNNIQVIGDLPIFIAHDSADVWSSPGLFQLEKNGRPTVVAGVPPDYFSETGQRWGNPHYRWEVMKQNNFNWWKKRISHLLELVDLIRIDHFRGFEAYWEIPADEKTAVKGKWVKAPGEAFLNSLRKDWPKLPFIAEDLGIITPPVKALKKKFSLPGMKILQFSFYSKISKKERPFEYEKNTFAYSGTHDNDTMVGWIEAEARKDKTISRRLNQYHQINVKGSLEQTCWLLLDLLFKTNAGVAMVQMQDYLCLGTEARMNFPGTTTNNWQWRCSKEAMEDRVLRRQIKQLLTTHGR